MFGPKLAGKKRVQRNRYKMSAFMYFSVLKKYYFANFLLAPFISGAENFH